MKYFQIEDHWDELLPIYTCNQATEIWYNEMEAYGRGKDEDYGLTNCRTNPLTPELTPMDYDSCDWRLNINEDGSCGPVIVRPEFWKYVCHSACHWLVNLSLFVAQQYTPEKQWRIVSGKEHSTVWDGEDTLWDANFLALGIDADEAWKLANDVHYQPNEYMQHL